MAVPRRGACPIPARKSLWILHVYVMPLLFATDENYERAHWDVQELDFYTILT